MHTNCQKKKIQRQSCIERISDGRRMSSFPWKSFVFTSFSMWKLTGWLNAELNSNDFIKYWWVFGKYLHKNLLYIRIDDERVQNLTTPRSLFRSLSPLKVSSFIHFPLAVDDNRLIFRITLMNISSYLFNENGNSFGKTTLRADDFVCVVNFRTKCETKIYWSSLHIFISHSR